MVPKGLTCAHCVFQVSFFFFFYSISWSKQRELMAVSCGWLIIQNTFFEHTLKLWRLILLAWNLNEIFKHIFSLIYKIYNRTIECIFFFSFQPGRLGVIVIVKSARKPLSCILSLNSRQV
jgi:hypothetical protein